MKSVWKISNENGGFLHVSGAKVKFDSSKPAGQRVVSIAYKNADGTYTEIEDAETYTIATNAFTAKGGDGYDCLKKAYEEGRVTDLGLSDWENFAEHLKSLGTVDPKVEGRIVDVVVKTVAPENFGGTSESPITHLGNVEVDITNATKLENAMIKGDLKLIGTSSESLTFSNIKVEGNLDISSIDSSNISLNGIEVTGDTTL